MPVDDFHEKPFDEGTLTKLRIFELYAQEWIPVFVSQSTPRFKQVHIFDFFSGPGTDSKGVAGSPLRILNQLRTYQKKGMAGWNKVEIVTHLFDEEEEKIEQLNRTLAAPEWQIPGVRINCGIATFSNALAQHRELLSEASVAKLLIIDQFGVNEVTDEVFAQLIRFPTTDFIFFLSSSTLHRFRDHPAIKQKIEKPEDSYDVHRAAFRYFQRLVPEDAEAYLAPFSIKKRGNIYGLIFGSQHPLGIHKFLQVAWANDEIAGEANFDIERENIRPGEGILALDVMRPDKIREFEAELEDALRAGAIRSEAELIRFCIQGGVTCRHSSDVLKKLKTRQVIDLNFWVPDVGRLKQPRPIRLL
jgi:three-Cys-motif partner protein